METRLLAPLGTGVQGGKTDDVTWPCTESVEGDSMLRVAWNWCCVGVLGLHGFVEPADAQPCGLQFDEAMADDLSWTGQTCSPCRVPCNLRGLVALV